MGLFDNTAFDGQHNLLPSLGEALKAFGDVGPAEWMMLLGTLLWLLILQVSLALIDRRDHQAGLTYVFFMMAAGVILVIALPSRLRSGSDFTRGQLWACVLLLLVASMRWYLRPIHAIRVAAPSPDAKPKTKPPPPSEETPT